MTGEPMHTTSERPNYCLKSEVSIVSLSATVCSTRYTVFRI